MWKRRARDVRCAITRNSGVPHDLCAAFPPRAATTPTGPPFAATCGHMPAIQMVIGLLVVVVLIAWLAAKLKLPYPILLVIGGLALSFVEGLPRAVLQPDVVFLILLPPLIFYAALLTSWRDFKAHARPISILAVGLVLATVLAVAVTCRWLVPGFTWPAAFVLGAILSPTDTVAAVAIAQRLKVPKRVIVILEGNIRYQYYCVAITLCHTWDDYALVSV